MKRITALLILVVMCLGLASCASSTSYDKITSVFLRRELEQEDQITSYYYAVHESASNPDEVHFNALSRNIDATITELSNHPVDRQVLEDTVKFCKEIDLISCLENYDEQKENTEEAFTGAYYSVTLQFEDGTEMYSEALLRTEWIVQLEEFFQGETQKILDTF